MKYRTLALSCACGKTPRHVSDIGLTCQHEIVFHWRCSRCRNEMYLVRTLSDCWRDCPTSEEETPPLPGDFMHSSEDRRFLRMLGVRVPDEDP
jgi:hypothetical protein